MTQLYDEIGIGYRNYRRPDPRLATTILRALGEAQTVVNVGAGAGSYEPIDRSVVAVEPSLAMIHQRQPDSAPVVQASATDLPFREAAFDVALAILTVHHWPNQVRGLTEIGARDPEADRDRHLGPYGVKFVAYRRLFPRDCGA